MKKHLVSALALGAMLLASVACSKRTLPVTSSVALSSELDSAAYSFGLMQGKNFANFLPNVPGDSLDRKRILEGFSAALLGKQSLIPQAEAQSFFEGYINRLQTLESNRLKAASDSALLANKSREGVQTTESGLQWRVLRPADGPRPTVQDTVVVHYEGRTIDGKVFDSSYQRNQPATFGLLQVIPGWTEGVCLMNKGSKYEFYIPSSLAYGERGAGEVIPPFSTLIFEVELLDIKPYVEPKTEPAPAPKAEPAKPKRRRK